MIDCTATAVLGPHLGQKDRVDEEGVQWHEKDGVCAPKLNKHMRASVYTRSSKACPRVYKLQISHYISTCISPPDTPENPPQAEQADKQAETGKGTQGPQERKSREALAVSRLGCSQHQRRL